jgi:hypothetical protein
MNPEHKNFIPQTELLNKLRDEIRGLDVDIMKDEASIGDFKRSATRTLVGLKFGGLIECCEKGVVRPIFSPSFISVKPYIALQIAGEYGKLIVSVRLLLPHSLNPAKTPLYTGNPQRTDSARSSPQPLLCPFKNRRPRSRSPPLRQ